jgi:hypothetical protein
MSTHEVVRAVSVLLRGAALGNDSRKTGPQGYCRSAVRSRFDRFQTDEGSKCGHG